MAAHTNHGTLSAILINSFWKNASFQSGVLAAVAHVSHAYKITGMVIWFRIRILLNPPSLLVSYKSVEQCFTDFGHVGRKPCCPVVEVYCPMGSWWPWRNADGLREGPHCLYHVEMNLDIPEFQALSTIQTITKHPHVWTVPCWHDGSVALLGFTRYSPAVHLT